MLVTMGPSCHFDLSGVFDLSNLELCEVYCRLFAHTSLEHMIHGNDGGIFTVNCIRYSLLVNQ